MENVPSSNRIEFKYIHDDNNNEIIIMTNEANKDILQILFYIKGDMVQGCEPDTTAYV